VVAGLVLVGAAVAAWGYASLQAPAGAGATQSIEVKPGMSARTVAGLLAEGGLVRSRTWFLAAVRWRGDGGKFQPGRYDLSPKMTALEILDRLVSGRVASVSVTIPEGYTIRQTANRLEEHGLGLAEGLRLAAADPSQFAVDFPLPAGASLEGYLFPDTYRVPLRRGAERHLIRLMLERFDDLVWRGTLQGRRPEGKLDLHQTITLASLVEAEAKLDSERPVIAGVLANRLRRGMRLQCDATVQYALGDGRKPRLLHSDLLIASPYNTYLHDGLPPGPINSPGLASIEAALHPAQVPYLYYVARQDGGHEFSVTFAQHQRAIQRVRRAP